MEYANNPRVNQNVGKTTAMLILTTLLPWLMRLDRVARYGLGDGQFPSLTELAAAYLSRPLGPCL